jgi:hypothetical protein
VADDVDAPARHLGVDEGRELADDRRDVVGAGVGRAAEARQVGREDATPGREPGGDVAPAGGRLGHAVQQQDRGAVRRAGPGLVLAQQEARGAGEDGTDLRSIAHA